MGYSFRLESAGIWKPGRESKVRKERTYLENDGKANFGKMSEEFEDSCMIR